MHWWMAHQPFYDDICDGARRAVGVRWVQLTIYDTDAGIVSQMAISGFDSPRIKRVARIASRLIPTGDYRTVVAHPHDNPSLTTLYLDGQPVETRLRNIAQGLVPATVMRLAELVGMRWCLAWPLKVQGKTIGALNFHCPRPFSLRQRQVAEAYVALASMALENRWLSAQREAQMEVLRESRERMVKAEERVREEVAALLHGSVQTKLLMVWHHVGEAMEELSPRHRTYNTLAQALSLVDEIRERDIRQLSHRLYPPVLAIGLLPALRTLAQTFSDVMAVSVRTSGERDDLEEELELCLAERQQLSIYRVVEEALNNAHRHGNAKEAQVTLTVGQSDLTVTIEDNGCGFDPDMVARGMGMWAMEGMAAQFDGELRVKSRPGSTTVVTASWPLKDRP